MTPIHLTGWAHVSPLADAIRAGDARAVRRLAEHGAALDVYGTRESPAVRSGALGLAAALGQVALVAILLVEGATVDPAPYTYTAPYTAAGDTIVAMLTAAGATCVRPAADPTPVGC